MASIGPSALGAKGCIEGLHRFAQGGRWAPFKKKGRHYDKTLTTALSGERKAAPPLVASPPPSPPQAVGLWVLSNVPHDSKGKRRANLPLRGGKRTKFVGSHKATENFVRRFPVERCRRQKGCIFHERARFACFLFATRARLFGFIIMAPLYF